MSRQKDLIELLNIFVQIVEAGKNTPVGEDDRLLDAEGLALKFFYHSSSISNLYQGITIPNLGNDLIDASSVNVLGRAALETFFVFYYIFASSNLQEEKDFRYLAWKLAGLLERQRLPIQSPQGKTQLQGEALLISPLQTKLKSNKCFTSLKPRQQNNILSKGIWRLLSWKEIAFDAGLSRDHAEAFYSYLCEYAHAGNLSILQLRCSRTLESQRLLCNSTIAVLIITTANMIKSYCSLFTNSQSILKESPDWESLIDIWVTVGATPLENANIKWENVDLNT